MTLTGVTKNEAARWMQNTLDGHNHPALDTRIDGITFDERRRVFTLIDNDSSLDLVKIYAEAEKQKQVFIATVDKYNTVANAGAVERVNIRAKHTWTEIISIQQKLSQEREDQSSAGLKGFLHKQGRRFGDNSEGFKAWLDLLPTESHYISVLCGGLKLILGAAARMSEIRDSIQSIMEEIPSTLSTTDVYIDLFGQSPDIHKCSADLYVAILNTLDTIVRELNKGLARRVTSAFFKQSSSNKELSANLNRINICGTRLANQAKICSMQQQKKMRDGQVQMAGWMSASAQDQERKMNEVLQNQKLAAQRDEALLKVLNEFLIHLKASPLPLRDTFPSQIRTWALLPQNGDHSKVQKIVSPPSISRAESNVQHLNEILSVLSYDRENDIPGADTATLLNLIYCLSYASQDRAVCLIKSPQLQEWITNTASSSLLVNGNISEEENLRQSALSFVCAKLVSSIRPNAEGKRAVIVVRWFCGQHTNMVDYGPGDTDYDAHPAGMLNSFLAQLITQLLDQGLHPELDLSPLPALSNAPRTSELCKLFIALATTLPRGTVLFCIIDGISHYEDFDRQMECFNVISMLQELGRLSEDITRTCLFKLLVTAPNRSRVVQDLFDDEETLTLEEYIPADEGFSALQWDLGAVRAIEG